MNTENTTTQTPDIDDLLFEYFAGKVVRKDLTKLVKEGANVPVYVLEYLLGSYCSSNDSEIVSDGLATVKRVLAENYVRPDEAEKVKSTIRERGSLKIIDKVTVTLNERRDAYEALLSNLGTKGVEIPASTVKKYEKLLVGGIWSIITMQYFFEEGQKGSPFIIEDLKPIQMPNMDMEELFEGRRHFTEEQWIDLLLRSCGYEPTQFDQRVKMHILCRMIPLVENNFNVCELGPRGTDRAQLCTFHSFSADLLRQHGSHIQIKPDFTIVNSIEDRIVFVEESLKALKASGEINIQLIPDDRKNIIMLLEKLFSSSYREEYSIELAKKVSWLPAFFKSYTNALRVNNCLDFGALLYFAQELLILNPNVAELVRLGWQYVCIDEFQDTNRIQYDILKLIVPEKDGNLFVVADDDQIIYQWNGASPERLLSLQNEYEMSVVQLPENYRCPSEIIDMANLIISHNKTRTPNKFPLLSKKDPSASSVIVAISYGTEDEEVQDIPRYILNNRWDPEECVVLARTGRLLEKAANALQANQIAAYIAKRKNEFESPAALWMYSIMRFALSRGSQDILRKICNSWQRLTNISIDIDEVETQAEADLGDYFRVWVEVALKETPSLKTDYIHILKKIQNGLVERNDYCGVLQDFLALKFLDDDLEQEELATWRELHECLQAEFSQTITLSQYMQEMELRSKSSPSPPNAVRCMTVHGAKGLEFKHVFLIGMADGVFPSFQAVNKGDRSKEMEEERRNCFVAITRVKETLNISFSSSYNGYRKNPSRFLEEMGFKVGD